MPINIFYKGDKIMDNTSYKEARYFAGEEEQLTRQKYNTILGGTLLWGIVINIIMATVFAESILEMNYFAVLIIYFVGSLVSTMVVYNSSNPVVSFVGFTGLSISMGLLLTFFVSFFDIGSIALAFASTAVVTGIMIGCSIFFPDFFRGLGRTLFITLLVTVFAELILSLIMGMDSTIFDYIIVAIFCGYIGYDWVKAQDYVPTVDNAVDSAADIYVDIVNLFIRLLSIIAKNRD